MTNSVWIRQLKMKTTLSLARLIASREVNKSIHKIVDSYLALLFKYNKDINLFIRVTYLRVLLPFPGTSAITFRFVHSYYLLGMACCMWRTNCLLIFTLLQLCLDMGTLALEVETLASDICFGLGLQDLGKRSPRNPRVLSLLSSLLERSIQKNEMLMETTQVEEVLTIFHGSRAPSLGIRQYIDRIFKYSCCSPSCFVVAQIYVDRFIQHTNVHLTSLSVHRLLITSVMVAAKFIDDA